MNEMQKLWEKSAVAAALPTEEKMQTAQQMAQDLYTLDSSIIALEQSLETAKKQRLEIVHRTLPAYLDSIGIDRLGIGGAEVDLVVENYYHANIPEDKREEAFSWLEDNEHGDLIKTVLTVQFHRGEMEIATEVARRIKAFIEAKGVPDRPIDVKKGVAWNTLTAFVKEQIEEGMVLPLEILGATIGRIVKLKPRNKSKRK
jgi:hypothetical protein